MNPATTRDAGTNAAKTSDGVAASGAGHRIAYAAAHVVPLVDSDTAPGAPARLDWDATLAVRRFLWRHGLGVAEAMDTSQRGSGLSWPVARELITRTAAEARLTGGRLAAGVATDQLPADETDPARIQRAYVEQLEHVVDAEATPVIMASRHLARAARTPADYLAVYRHVIATAGVPVILHWLGPVFDPALVGYWGTDDAADATNTVVELIESCAPLVDGIKISLLDVEAETELRRRLPAGVRVYTGDDFHYPELILGDGQRHSDALLGVFSAIAPAAADALSALAAGDTSAYRKRLFPTVALARHLFASPTHHYKTGIAFLAWLNGLQPGFVMIDGAVGRRSACHLVRAYRLAVQADVLVDPDLAAHRVRSWCDTVGLSA